MLCLGMNFKLQNFFDILKEKGGYTNILTGLQTITGLKSNDLKSGLKSKIRGLGLDLSLFEKIGLGLNF